MQGKTTLRTVEEGEGEIPTFAPAAPAARVATEGLLLALRALSARAIVALASLVDLALLGSAFMLWLSIIGEPSVSQIVSVGLYAVFVLAAILLRRR